MATPAGWYPDPDSGDPRVTRWWNGTAWTDHRKAPVGVFVPTPEPTVEHKRKTRRWLIAAAAVAVAAIAVGAMTGGFARDTSNDLTTEQWAELRAGCAVSVAAAWNSTSLVGGREWEKKVEACAIDRSLDVYPTP